MTLASVVSRYVHLKRSSGMRFVTATQVLTYFARTMGDIDIQAIRPKAVSDFLRGRGRITTTWHQKYGVLKSFFRFAIGRGYTTKSPLPMVIPQRPPYPIPYIYSTDELRRILVAISSRHEQATTALTGIHPPPLR